MRDEYIGTEALTRAKASLGSKPTLIFGRWSTGTKQQEKSGFSTTPILNNMAAAVPDFEKRDQEAKPDADENSLTGFEEAGLRSRNRRIL